MYSICSPTVDITFRDWNNITSMDLLLTPILICTAYSIPYQQLWKKIVSLTLLNKIEDGNIDLN